MATTLAILGTAAAGASVVSAAQAPSGVSATKTDRFNFRRPLEQGALEEQLRLQAFIQLGAPLDTIIDDFIVRRVASGSSPSQARIVQDGLQVLRNELATNGATVKAHRLVNQLNSKLERGFATGRLRGGAQSIGGPAVFSIKDGQLSTNFTGPEGEQLNALIGQTQQIFTDRLTTQQNVARAGASLEIPTRGDIEAEEQQQIALQQEQLNRQFDEQAQQITERANLLGISPGAALGELEEQRLLLNQQIQTEGGLTRALQLLGGQQNLTSQGILAGQNALNPTLSGPALAAGGQSLQAQTQGLSIAAGLATASAEADAARSAGLSNAFGNLAGAGLIGSQLVGGGAPAPTSSTGGSFGGGLLTSGNLQQRLGADPFGLGSLFPGRP